MKLLNISPKPDSPYDNAVVIHATEWGVTLLISDMGKVKTGLAFRPDHAREVAATLVKAADCLDAMAAEAKEKEAAHHA